MVKRKCFLLDVLSAHVPLKRIRMLSPSDDVTIGPCPMCYDETYVNLKRMDKVKLGEFFPQNADLWVCHNCSKTLIELQDLKLQKVKIEQRIEQIVCCIKSVEYKKEHNLDIFIDMLEPTRNVVNGSFELDDSEHSEISQELEIEEHCKSENNEVEVHQFSPHENEDKNSSLAEVHCMELEVTDDESEVEVIDEEKVLAQNNKSEESDLDFEDEISDDSLVFSCKDCGKYFTSYPILEYHLREDKCLEDLWRLFCETCSIGFSSFEHLLKHIQPADCDIPDEKYFLCGHCQRKFSDKWLLLNHLKYGKCKEIDIQSATEEIQNVAVEEKSDQFRAEIGEDFTNFIKIEGENETAFEEALPTFIEFQEETQAQLLRDNSMKEPLETNCNEEEFLGEPICPRKLQFLQDLGLF